MLKMGFELRLKVKGERLKVKGWAPVAPGKRRKVKGESGASSMPAQG